MNSQKHSRTRAALLALALFGIGGLGGVAWSATSGSNPSVTVKVDEKPVASDASSPLGASYAPIVKKVAPSVVKVLVAEKAKSVPVAEGHPFFDLPGFREFFGEQYGRQMPGRGRGTFRQPPAQGLGSGVIVSDDGYILTNSHVVRGADTIKVSLNDGRELTAKVVGSDPETDLAVIKVDAKDLPAITFTDSDKVEVGDKVLAVGNPFGIGQTVTSGMVSGLGRATLGLDYEDFIQTDAAINPGNSGGALVDAHGRLIGINTAILSRSGGFQGIGFAVPANLARNVMEQLVKNGKVIRGYLGVSVQDITPTLAEHFELKERKGALVAEVVPDSPADKAGLENGDIITKFNGKPVNDARHLKLTVATVPPGEKVKTEVLRDGDKKTIEVTITKRPGDRSLARNDGGTFGDEDTGTLRGVGVADLDTAARREFGVPRNVRGALVTSVDPDSAAAAAGLQPGDVIQEINRQPVRNADDAIRLTENTESQQTLVRIWNQRGTRYLVVDESGAE
jgi:periplasmic serine protease, Do/DeqQ family